MCVKVPEVGNNDEMQRIVQNFSVYFYNKNSFIQ